MTGSSIAAGLARGLIDLAVSKGANKACLCARSGIEPKDLDDQDNRVAFDTYISLMRAAKEATGDQALALHFGEAFDMTELSIVGLIGLAAESATEAYAQFDRFTRLIVDVEVDEATGKRFTLSRSGDAVWLVDTRKHANAFPELTESSFARMASAPRRLGIPPLIHAVHFTHAAPSYREEYDRIFQVPVTFESDKNALLLPDKSWLNVKNPNPSRYVFGVLSERAEALLTNLQKSSSTRGQVESLLLPMLHKGDPNMDSVASQLRLNRQALYRRLRAEGVTFEQLLDDLRHKLALHYLNGNKASVTEVAYLVGFSDPAAFSRAFKRWTGKNPRAMRG